VASRRAGHHGGHYVRTDRRERGAFRCLGQIERFGVRERRENEDSEIKPSRSRDGRSAKNEGQGKNCSIPSGAISQTRNIRIGKLDETGWKSGVKKHGIARQRKGNLEEEHEK